MKMSFGTNATNRGDLKKITIEKKVMNNKDRVTQQSLCARHILLKIYIIWNKCHL